MKPTIAADEMFPEGAGPFSEYDEVNRLTNTLFIHLVSSNFSTNMLCMFLFLLKAGGSSGLLMDLAANEKDVHADFFNGSFNLNNLFLLTNAQLKSI